MRSDIELAGTTDRETEHGTGSIDDALREVVKEAIHEAHDEGVRHRMRTSGARDFLPMLLGAVALVAVGYVLRDRFGSMDRMTQTASKEIRHAADQTAHRTEEMAEGAAEQIRKEGQEVSERAQTMSDDVADRVEEGSERAGETVETGGKEAAERIERGSEAVGEKVEDGGTEASE